MVVAGGCDYYPGSATSSPGFSFSVPTCAWPARATCSRGSSACASSSTPRACSRRQKQLPMPPLPHSIGVITGESGKARDDVLAALARRGWAGRLVWGFAPVQDRHAAPAIVRALGDLAAVGGGRGRDRHARRRLARGPAVLLRRDPVPHSCAARRAGDRIGRAPHRPHAARRRRRGQLLDAHARRRGGGGGRLHASPEEQAAAAARCASTRASAGPRQASPHGARLREHGRRAVLSRARLLAISLARSGRAPGSPARAACTSSCARSAQARAGGSSPSGAVTERRAVVLERKSALLAAGLPRAPPARAGAARARARRPRSAAHARARLRARRSSADGQPSSRPKGSTGRRRAASCGSPTDRWPRRWTSDERAGRGAGCAG